MQCWRAVIPILGSLRSTVYTGTNVRIIISVVISQNRNNGNASVEGLKGEAPRTRHQRRRGVNSGEECPYPQPTESGERRKPHPSKSTMSIRQGVMVLFLFYVHVC